MKNIFFTIFALCFTLSCQAQTKSDKVGVTKEIAYTDITVAQAKKMAVSKNVVILDVRTPGEVMAGKVDNAINIDFQANDFRTKLSVLDKEATYMVYCQAGGRSAKAVSIMKEMGFKQIFHMKDGFRSWSE